MPNGRISTGATLSAPGSKIDGVRVIADQQTASRRSCLFLGMLEIARNNEVEIEQDATFRPIILLERTPPATILES